MKKKIIIVVIVLLVLGGIGFASVSKNIEAQKKRELEEVWKKIVDFSVILYRISEREVSTENLLPFLATNIKIGMDSDEFGDESWVISRKMLREELDFYFKSHREKNNNDTEKFVKSLVKRVNVIDLLASIGEIGTYIVLNEEIMKVGKEKKLLPVDKDNIDFGDATSVFSHKGNGEIGVITKAHYQYCWWYLTLVLDNNSEWKISTLIIDD